MRPSKTLIEKVESPRVSKDDIKRNFEWIEMCLRNNPRMSQEEYDGLRSLEIKSIQAWDRMCRGK